MIKRNRSRQLFFAISILLLLEITSFFFVKNRMAVVGIIVVSHAFFGAYAWLAMKKQQLSDYEKIKAASVIAENTLDYTFNEVSVGIINYSPRTNEAEWLNPFAENVFYKDEQRLISPELIATYLEQAEKGKDIFKVGEKVYRYSVDQQRHTITFRDITAESNLSQEKIEMQTAIGIISVDNYDDVTDRMDDKQISYLNSYLTTIISDWLEEYEVFYKRLNAERYFFIAQLEDIRKMMNDQFQILDKIRKESQNQDIAITLSMGIAYGGETIQQTGKIAQTNLDMALVRGGDQVVIKEGKDAAKPVFYGGQTNSVAKRTRVRSRAMGTAIQGILSEASDVYIMGHRFPDMDAIGAAFGMAKLVEYHQKKAWIVFDERENIPDALRVLDELKKYPELAAKVIHPKAAMKQKSAASLLVMVDYHKPSLSISQELYEKFEKVIIIDHHRRGDEFPEKPLLTYIESSASSASELITELIEYQSDSKKQLSKIEATLLLAGIVVDTKSFSVRTAPRTFDVASYLRTCGADSALVQYLLSSDLDSYLQISHLMSRSDFVSTEIVVVAGEEEITYDSVVAAKTADTLLSMSGINAAFVIIKRTDGKIGISARSNGAINVQLIMEHLGGGGHFTNAAVQLEQTTIAETKEQLLQDIHRNVTMMYKED